jgi:predicted DNA-binding transcriptional regulator AlpA
MSALEDSIRTMVREIVLEELSERPRAPQPLLTADQVAERLGINDKQAVYRLKRENKLKAVHLSETRFMFQPEEVERFIRDGGVKPCRLIEAPRKVGRGGAK